LQKETGLDAKGYSERNEKRILDALGRGLLKEFPNPDRAGCPGSDVLKSIASHEMPLAEAEKWLDHLTSCSPCYSDFSHFQAAQQRRRTRTLLAIAAGILIVVCLAGWAFFLRHSESMVAQTAVVDLRNRSIPRGTEQNPAEPPLEISRAATHWNIYLPLGSGEGSYEVRLITPAGASLAATTGIARLNDHITSLQVAVSLTSSRPGKYILQVRRVDQEWNSYGLLLR
jgi:hypothetical protein